MRTKIAILTCAVALCHFTAYSQPFELPWDDGVSYHVSRTGTPAPSGSTASTCYNSAYASFSPHTYVAIDFDSPNGVYDPVRASDDGTVIFAGINGSLTSGYGRLVKIQHANGTITYYAHLETIYVSVNDVVEQGCIVGDGGTTGNSTGDHIHFEWRDDGDVAFSNNQYPTFTECSCIPKQGYCYESGNANGTCGNPCTAPSYDEPCSAGSLSVNSSCSFVTRTIECATKSSQISNASCDQPSNVDVWFTFTIPSGTFGIRTESISISSNDCGLAIYTGSCSSLIERHCIIGGNPSQSYMPWDNNINLNSYAGQTGYIRLWEYGTASQTGDFEICITGSGGGSEDITVTNTYVSSTTVSCGGTVDVESDHVYSGNQLDADLPSFDLDYYLSTDCNYNSSDVPLGNGETSSLGSDDPVNTETATLTIPAGTSTGTYYILFVGDADDELTTEDETNNIGCEQITVTCGSEDITVTNTYVSSTTVACGSTVDVESDHVYSGNQLDADLPSFDLDYYLSTDCNYNSSDVPLGNGETSSLGSDDPVNTETATLTIPAGTSTGTYYILFVGDADDELTTEDETNNVGCEQITVTCVVGQEKVHSSLQFIVYPNPNNGTFAIQFSTITEQESNISIMDIVGQLVYQTDTKKVVGEISLPVKLNAVSSGVYFVRLKSGSDFVTRKIVINQ